MNDIDVISQRMTGTLVPIYMIEILTKNYCKSFLRMSIVKDDDGYIFSYDVKNLKRLDISKLRPHEKFGLIATLIEMGAFNEQHLVAGENYLLEPELIYETRDGAPKKQIKLMFYPDATKMPFEDKLGIFMEKIKAVSGGKEREVIMRAQAFIEAGDMKRAHRYLVKTACREKSELKAA